MLSHLMSLFGVFGGLMELQNPLHQLRPASTPTEPQWTPQWHFCPSRVPAKLNKSARAMFEQSGHVVGRAARDMGSIGEPLVFPAQPRIPWPPQTIKAPLSQSNSLPALARHPIALLRHRSTSSNDEMTGSTSIRRALAAGVLSALLLKFLRGSSSKPKRSARLPCS